MNTRRHISLLLLCFIATCFLTNGMVSAADKVVVIPLLGDEAIGNATVADVLKGKTFSNASSIGLTGTRPPAPVAKTGQSTSYATGDDGDLEKGVVWPMPRFTNNGNGTVKDNLTGLIWGKDANCFGARTWSQALGDCNTLASGNCGLSDGSSAGDWRLPHVNELLSLIDYGECMPPLPSGHPFIKLQSDYYWSSTTEATYVSIAWRVRFGYGSASYYGKSNSYYVCCVRGDN